MKLYNPNKIMNEKVKKILIINPIPLYPTIMASQVRVIDMVKRLSQDHVVDVATHVKDKHSLSVSIEKISRICNKYHPIFPINYTTNSIHKKLIGGLYLLSYYLLKSSSRYFYWSSKKSIKQLRNLIDVNKYDIVQVNHWYQADVFKGLNDDIIKVIDTHDILYQKKKLYYKKQYGEIIPFFKRRELNHYEHSEKRALESCNILISISSSDELWFKKKFLDTKNVLISTGQDIEKFKAYPKKTEKNTILFYGAMGSQQNIDAFFRFYNYILPLVREKITNIHCLIVGSNPHTAIKKLHDGKLISVTGFVEDIKEHISKATVMILPLEIGGGFRSRIVEVMAMGVPVVGTYNALSNLEMEHEKEGFITDSNQEMAEYLVQMIEGVKHREEISKNSKKFVQKYSIEKTYGKLSTFYLDL